MHRICWGVIGCGAVTEVKSLPAFQKVEGFEVLSVMRRDFEKAEDFATRHGVPKVHQSAKELIEDHVIDAIYIATPPDSHRYYALEVAKAGKICCIEKPMADSYEDAKDILEAFEKAKLPLFISYYRRSLPRFLKVKEWLDEKKIGEVRHVDWKFFKKASEFDKSGEDNWRTDRRVAYGGYFDDVGSHGLDLITFLLGDIKEAKGVSQNQQELYSAKDAISGSWLHESGVVGSGSWNFGMPQREDIVTIYGSSGKIIFSALDENPIYLENDKEKLSLEIENPPNIQLYHAQNIKEHLEGNITHPSLGESGLHTSWVMDKILTQIMQ
jgi:predicted dehydrogenase